VVGHAAIAQATADGYTIGLITVEISMMHWQGLTELSGASYTPIGLVNADPAGLQVRADAPYKNVNDLVAAIKANPGKFKASGTGQGGIWHLAIAGMLQDMKVNPAAAPWVPSNGAAPGLQDLVAGGVDVAPCSLPEARSLIDAGKVRSLAVMANKRAALYPNVPTLKEATGSNWTMAAWRGIAAPKGVPADVRDKLVAAIKKIASSKEYNDFMTQRGFGVIYEGPDEFAKFMAEFNLHPELAKAEIRHASEVERLKADKAAAEEELMKSRQECAKLQDFIETMQKQVETTWASERMANAVLRERINDVASEVVRVAAE